MGRRAIVLLLALVALAASGCPPRVVVKKNPGPLDRGVRYYRPKPYLFLTPYQPEEHTKDATFRGAPSDQYVTIALQYLPDFGEEYSIHVRTGVGTAEVELQLEDGWNLTTLNQNLDSQFDENISAVADLISAVAPEGVAVTRQTGPQDRLVQGVVRATNVPLGYYEAVIGKSPEGSKQLFGWRYIGFLPYQHCPVDVCDATSATCNSLHLYGLVFDQGIMTFKPLYTVEELGQRGHHLVDVPTALLPGESVPRHQQGDPSLRRPREPDTDSSHGSMGTLGEEHRY